MRIRKIDKDKKRYLELLLLGDEQESMIDRYLEQGDMYILQEDGGEDNKAVGVCVVTAESNDVLELKNIAVAPEYQHQGWGRRMIDFLEKTYGSSFQILQAGTGDVPATVLFYEACGFHSSHRIPDFFTKYYDHPIYECGKLLTDMVYFQKKLVPEKEGNGKDAFQQEERLVWRLKKRQVLYDERWLHLESRSYQLADGTAIEPYYVTCPNDFTVIVAVTESGNFLMERLYRPGAELIMTEPPAGAIEPGEEPVEAAKRELREETGYEAESLEFLCKIAPNAATASNYAWCYLARNARPVGKQKLDKTEALEVFEMTRQQVIDGLRAGEFIQAVHVAALYRALDKMKEKIDF